VSAEFGLALDAGNGGGRALLLRLSDGASWSAWRAWTHRASSVPGGRDFDLDAAWRTFAATTREVLARAGAAASQVVGIAATSLRHGLVALDRSGAPLYAAPTGDGRAFAEGFRLAAERGEELHARSGRWPGPVFGAARLLWLDAHLPGGLPSVDVAFALSDWVAWRLSGVRATDRTHACETLLLDLETGAWAPDLCAALGIRAGLLAPLVEPGTRIGTLSAAAAADLGLVAGIPVAQGGADTSCGMLGLGALRSGDAGVIAGTSAPVQLVLDAAPRDRRVWTGHHLHAGARVLESNMGAVGEVLEFAGRLWFPDAEQPAARLMAEAELSVPGAKGMLSSAGAEVMNAAELSLPSGALWFSHHAAGRDPDARRHAARALAEGMAFGMRANLEQLEQISGQTARALHLGGGMSRSRIFAAILAAALHRPLRVAGVAESSALGAALCAAVGAGRFADLAGAARALVKLRDVPADPGVAAACGELYPLWSKLRAARAGADAIARQHAIASLAREAAGAAPARRWAQPPRILVTADLDPEALDRLRELGPVEYQSYREHKRVLQRESLVAALRGFEIFVTEIDLVDVDSLLQLPELRIVASCRGNAVNVDVDACSAFGVPVLNAPGRNAQAVADLALAFMLMLARKLVAADRVLHQPHAAGDVRALGSSHARLRGDELWERTVGLVGIGAVGREVARRVRACGARVLAFDPFVSDEAALRDGAERVGLEALMERSDFISLHAAVTPASRGLIGADALARARPSAYLINTARAALVDETALAAALREGRLAGAAIDTFSVEPPGDDHPLLQFENVISAPHVGGNTRQVAIHQGRIVADALALLLAGGTPRELLNPAALEGFDGSGRRREPDPDTLARLRAAPGPAISDLQKGG
jgi:autoinducer 2 (AI-2) kinase